MRTTCRSLFSRTSLDFASAGNANQRAVANAIQTGLSAGGSTAGPFGLLFNMDRATYLTALSQLSGEIATGGSPTGLSAMNLFISTTWSIPSSTRAGRGRKARRWPSRRSRLRRARPTWHSVMCSERQGFECGNASFRAVARRDPRGRTIIQHLGVRLWRLGQERRQCLTGGSAALDTRIAGGAVGVDYRPTFNTVFGLAVGGAQSSYSLAGGLGTGEAEHRAGRRAMGRYA